MKLTRIKSVTITEGWFSNIKKDIFGKPSTGTVHPQDKIPNLPNQFPDSAMDSVVKRKQAFRTKALPKIQPNDPALKFPKGATTPNGQVPKTTYEPKRLFKLPTNVPNAKVIINKPNDVSALDIAISKDQHPNGFSMGKGTHGVPDKRYSRPPVSGIQYPTELSPQEKKIRADVDKQMLDIYSKRKSR